MMKDTVLRGVYPLSLFSIVAMGIAQWENPFLEHKSDQLISAAKNSTSEFGNCKTKLNPAVTYCPDMGQKSKRISAGSK